MRAALIEIKVLGKTAKSAALWTNLERKVFEIANKALRDVA